jgi:hypothetical protein
MSGVVPPLPLFVFMAPTGTSFCFDLRLRLQFHISSFIVVNFCLSSHSFAPYLSFPVCAFVSVIYAPLYNINFCLLFFRSSFLLNFVLYLCVFSLSLHCTYPSSPSLRCCFPLNVSFTCVSFSLVYLQSCFFF